MSVPVASDGAGAIDVGALVRRFHEEHRRLYGTSVEGEPVELVTFGVVGTGSVPKARLPRLPTDGHGRVPIPKGERAVRFRPARPAAVCPVLERATLSAGVRLDGPAIVEEPGATIVLYPGHRARIDEYGNVLIAVPPPGAAPECDRDWSVEP